MSLTIERFATRCRVSPRAEIDRSRIERVVRDDMRREVAQALPKEWDHNGAVVRIRRLNVAFKIAVQDVNSSRAGKLWAAALVAALRRALAGIGAEVARGKSRAEWLGRYLEQILAGTAMGRWEYEEFTECHLSGVAAPAILAALARQPVLAPAALAWLSEKGQLETLLAVFDERGLTELCALLSDQTQRVESVPSETGDALSPCALAEIASAVLRHTPPQIGSRLGTWRRAIRLYIALYREGASSVTAEDLHHALMTLQLLLEIDAGSDAAADARSLAGVPAAVIAPFRAARAALRQPRPNADSEASAMLRQAITELRSYILPVTGSTGNERAPWISGEAAGLFLLVDRIQRLGWPARWQRSSLAVVHGSRLETYCLAGLALAVLGRGEDPLERIDPAVAIFAGWLGEPHLAGFRAFLAHGSPAERAALLDEATPATHPDVASWSALFDALAQRLVREFAATLRGFRRSSRAFIVEKFLAISGRVRMEERRILVVLAAMPLRVVLRIAGADNPVESVSWLSGRRLEFDFDEP